MYASPVLIHKAIVTATGIAAQSVLALCVWVANAISALVNVATDLTVTKVTR